MRVQHGQESMHLLGSIFQRISPNGEACLESNFKAHRNELETILKMSNEDKQLVRIAFDYTRVERSKPVEGKRPNLEGISQERWNAYKTLFQSAGIREGIGRNGDDVFFTVMSPRNNLDWKSGRWILFLLESSKAHS